MQDCLDGAPVRMEQHTFPQCAFIGWAGAHIVDADGADVRVFLTRLVVRWLWHVTPPPDAWLWRGRARPPSPGAGERWMRLSRDIGAQREHGRSPSVCTGKACMAVMISQRHTASNGLEHASVIEVARVVHSGHNSDRMMEAPQRPTRKGQAWRSIRISTLPARRSS
jgi:hypothetical protein